MTPTEPLLLPYGSARPTVAADGWVAPGVTLIGDVRIGAEASVWYGTVLRADSDWIEIGERSNVQDGSVAHTADGSPVVLGSGVSVGHRVVLHGCTIEDDVLVGMGAILLNGCSIGTGSLIAAGTVVLEGAVIPPRSLVAGVPGKVRRQTTDAELEHIHWNAATYLGLVAGHRQANGT